MAVASRSPRPTSAALQVQPHRTWLRVCRGKVYSRYAYHTAVWECAGGIRIGDREPARRCVSVSDLRSVKRDLASRPRGLLATSRQLSAVVRLERSPTGGYTSYFDGSLTLWGKEASHPLHPLPRAFLPVSCSLSTCLRARAQKAASRQNRSGANVASWLRQCFPEVRRRAGTRKCDLPECPVRLCSLI